MYKKFDYRLFQAMIFSERFLLEKLVPVMEDVDIKELQNSLDKCNEIALRLGLILAMVIKYDKKIVKFKKK